MITSAAWRGKRYAVLGLARSGAATVDALLASGAGVVAWDSSEEVRASFKSSRSRSDGEGDRSLQASGGGAATHAQQSPSTALRAVPLPTGFADGEDLSFADPLTLDLKQFDAVVASPGIPLNRHPISAAAAAAGVPIIGDIELFAQARASLPRHKVVGITGTNGKSTTTALVHHILRTAGVPTTMGGNIGLPILAQAPLTPNENGVGVYVLELSSYQIDLTQSLDCDIAVLLNITPDHLDRYESFEAYAASKARLFEMQHPGSDAVFSGDEGPVTDICNRFNEARAGNVLWVDNSFVEILGVSVFDGEASIFGAHVGWQRDWPSLLGPHNAENAGAAIAVCHLLSIDEKVVAESLRTFPGLPHRMERVADRSGVLFVNDSKATNPASVAPALAAFDAVHWILGGRAKSDDLDACRPHFGHVRAAYVIGEAGPRFAAILRPHMPVSDCGTLERAVGEAAAAALPGEVVLLSPASASFDQFRDFEARGDAFRAAVEALG